MIWKAILIPFYLMWPSTVMDDGIGIGVDHGIYMTVIEINQDNDEGQVIIKSFSDDLVSALRAMNFNIPQDANPCAEMDAFNAYIDQHLKIEINGVVLDLVINECAIESDTHWAYMDFEIEGTLKKVEIETDWMTALFGDQQNIIKVKSGDQRTNDRLSAEKTVTTLTIDN